MTCILERLKYIYPVRRDLINGRTEVAEINLQGKKYDMYCETPLIFVSGGKSPNNLAHRHGRNKFAGGKIWHVPRNALNFRIRREGT
jgi:hypothetical protein